MERNIVETRFKAKKIDFLVMVALKPNEQNKNRLIWWARFPVLEIFNFDFFSDYRSTQKEYKKDLSVVSKVGNKIRHVFKTSTSKSVCPSES